MNRTAGKISVDELWPGATIRKENWQLQVEAESI
jgi:hypothetical protein